MKKKSILRTVIFIVLLILVLNSDNFFNNTRIQLIFNIVLLAIAIPIFILEIKNDMESIKEKSKLMSSQQKRLTKILITAAVSVGVVLTVVIILVFYNA